MTKVKQIILHILFAAGIIITVAGWFFDRAKTIKPIMFCISTDYVHAKQALSDLKSNPKIALTKDHIGFNILIDNWPNLKERESVVLIGSSIPYVEFGSKISNKIQILAYDKDQNKIEKSWEITEAEVFFDSSIDNKLFVFGAIIFWIGIIITVVSYFVNSVKKTGSSSIGA